MNKLLAATDERPSGRMCGACQPDRSGYILAAVLTGAEQFAVLTVDMAAFIQSLVMVLNVVGAIVLIGVFWAIRRSVLAPLDSALQLAHRIARGDLTGTVQVASKDEIGRLMAALREMQGSLAGMVEHLRQNSERL